MEEMRFYNDKNNRLTDSLVQTSIRFNTDAAGCSNIKFNGEYRYRFAWKINLQRGFSYLPQRVKVQRKKPKPIVYEAIKDLMRVKVQRHDLMASGTLTEIETLLELLSALNNPLWLID